MTSEQQLTQECEFIQSFRRFQSDVFRVACSKGWWDKRNQAMAILEESGLGDFGNKLIISQLHMLIVTETAEGVEGLRKDLPDDKCPQYPMVVVEAADAIIRYMDMAERFGWPLAEAIVAKIKMNEGRPHLHGGKAF